MENNKYTFWKLLDENSIEIPIIQRDYAQGRAKESRIRDKFLDVLYETIQDPDKTINLDFIYGRIKDKKLIPLDGQQRLTTLFLLHWYLVLKDEKLTDDTTKKLQKFTYETRVSSREFCKALVDNTIDLSKEKISEVIEDKNWFFKSWKKDPTIKSMLNMLDAIHGKFSNSKNLFDKLISDDNPPITFDFLPLDDFNLSDELYIKMNARGKPLTEFENFKANLEGQLNEMKDKPDIKSKLDNSWQDIFWNKNIDRLNDKNLAESDVLKSIDDSYFNFFKNITVFFALNKENKIDNLERVDIFEYKYTKGDIEQINLILDSLSDNKQKTINAQIRLIRENLTIFDDFLKPYSKSSSDKNITYEERMRFYALMLFFDKCKELDKDLALKTHFRRWMRVAINLINNTLYNSFDDFKASVGLLNELSGSIGDIYEGLKNYKNATSEQLKEEIQKAYIIANGNQWENEFLIAEKHWYLDGQIGFLLELSKKDDAFDINEYKKYRDKFTTLWGLKEHERHLIQRALLTFTTDDKITYITETKHGSSEKYTLCTFGTGLREKNENWRRVFGIKNFKDLLDKLNTHLSHLNPSNS